MKQQSRQENIMYLALWGLLFAAPVLSLYLRALSNESLTFQWSEVMMVWQHFTVYLLLFLIHNFLIAPLLVYENKRLLYGSLFVAMIAGFMIYQCTGKPANMAHKPQMEKMDFGPDDGHRPNDDFHPDDDFRPDHEPDRMHKPDDMHKPDHEPMFKPDGKKMRRTPPAIIGERDIVATLVLFLMLGMNLGIKYYFKTRDDKKKLIRLEKENLEQQLEYLKYQINPHFFMNTLNNIHALVDIDAEKAKSTILELSKMMRFVLYEGDKKGVPLTREFDFIRNYVTLMRLRYTDKVKITVDLPTQAPDRQIPPLMLITFIENAFKHGISYQHESFIDVKVGIEGTKLRFTCRNSKADKPNQEKGGVGLTNVKQRLNLLYDNNFTLNIQDEPDIYNVELLIPLT